MFLLLCGLSCPHLHKIEAQQYDGPGNLVVNQAGHECLKAMAAAVRKI
jgi:hypothetical protein